jgi:ubiquinone/menaquinone biosynthesis C-methylase UbiE
MFHPKGPSFWELTVQALSSTTKGYDLIASKFEYTPFRTPDPLLAGAMDAIGGPGSIETAMDVCCGTGAAVRALRPLCTDKVVGLDLSAGMLGEADRLAQEAPSDAIVELIQGDAMEMTFDKAFDAITCFGAFGHIMPEDQDRFIGRIFQALKPGGRFVFISRRPPTLADKEWWVYRGFNAVMRARNAVLDPPFIMYYLIFTVPRALDVCSRQGFAVEVRDVFEGPYGAMRLIVATRPESDT